MKNVVEMQEDLDRKQAYLDEIEEKAKTDLFGAAAELARGLMRGDRATLRLGYSLGSALIATAEHFNLDRDQVAVVAEKIAVANFECYSPSAASDG